MTDEQIKEVMLLADELADACAGCDSSHFALSHRKELKSYLRTIGEPENTFPLNPNGASKWAHLQKHDGAEAIGVVFRTGSGSVGSLVDGRVVWADWLAHPNGSKPESVNAELLDAAKSVLSNLEKLHSHPADKDGFRGWENGFGESAGDVLQDSIDALKLVVSESAIDTPAKVSPCAGHAAQQEADEARACETCGGRGEVGGFVGGGAPGYETHPCPDCRSGKASLGGLQFKCWRCLDTGFIPKAASLPEPPDVKCPNGCLPKKGGA